MSCLRMFASLFCLSLGLVQIAAAEEFTLTRGDGKVFTCTDQGGGPVPASLTICDCLDSVYNINHGQVIGGGGGANTLDVCRQLTGNPKLASCRSLPGTTVTCDCMDSVYNINHGQVVGSSGADVMASCKSLTGNPKLSNCQGS